MAVYSAGESTDNRSDVRVRFAPSPTGLLHIGGLRTALYNYLFARKHGGTFVLRIEDTDQERFVEAAEEDILSSLAWAGLAYDEGPDVGGAHAPYHQSRRTERYRHYASRLIESGNAYYAFDTKAELEQMKERLDRSGHSSVKYDAASRMSMTNSLTLSREAVAQRLAAGDPHVIRLKVPPGETVRFNDLIRRNVSFDTSEVDDQVLVKSDGLPTYHLANVVDDHAMGITHVIRGEEWLSSTPKHILLYRYLGWEPPQLAHLPLILSPTGGKLSKRSADEIGLPVSVRQYREAGYEPGALLNFLAFLGWNPGTEQEIFTLDELVTAFSIDRVGSSGVQFNLEKLRWFNQQCIRQMGVDALAERARVYLQQHGFSADEAYLKRVAALMQERVSLAEEIVTTARFLFEDPTAYEEAGVQKRWKPHSSDLVRRYADQLEAMEDFSAETAEQALREVAAGQEVKAAELIHPARLAVSGVSFGPSLFDMMELLGRETCLRRLRKAADTLASVQAQ